MINQCRDLHDRSISLLNMITQLTTTVEQYLVARPQPCTSSAGVLPAEHEKKKEDDNCGVHDHNQSAASSHHQADNDVSAASNKICRSEQSLNLMHHMDQDDSDDPVIVQMEAN